MKREEEKQKTTPEVGEGGSSQIFIPAPSLGLKGAPGPSKGAYLPKNGIFYFTSTLQEGKGGDNFLPGSKEHGDVSNSLDFSKLQRF